jgi:hypothetical protein
MPTARMTCAKSASSIVAVLAPAPSTVAVVAPASSTVAVLAAASSTVAVHDLTGDVEILTSRQRPLAVAKVVSQRTLNAKFDRHKQEHEPGAREGD